MQLMLLLGLSIFFVCLSGHWSLIEGQQFISKSSSVTKNNITFPSSIKVGHIFCEVRKEQAAIAFNESVKRIRLDGVLPNTVNFEFSYSQGCEDVSSLSAAIVYAKDNKTDVIIGPESTAGMQVAAMLAAIRNTPIIGYASFGDDLSNKSKFSTLIRVSFAMGSLGEAVGKVLKRFNWNNVALIRSNITECDIGLSGVYNILRDPSLNLRTETVAVTDFEIGNALRTAQKVARIIILCYGYEPWMANNFLKLADNQSMVNSEYVYIVPYFLKTRIEDNSARPWEGGNTMNTTSEKEQLRRIYQRVMVVQASGDESSVLETFKTTIEDRAAEINVNSSIRLIGKEPLYLPMLHDALFMYASAVNRSLLQGEDYKDGSDIFAAVRKAIRFKGVTGYVTMDNSSDRYSDYDVYAMTIENSYEKMMTIEAIYDNVTGDLSQVIGDWRKDLFPPMPPDQPNCGYVNEKCPNNHSAEIGATVGSVCGVLLILVALFFYYRKQKMEKDIFRMAWKLRLGEVKFMANKSSNSNSLRSVGMNSMRGTIDSTDSHSTMDLIPEGDFKAMASVRGTPAYAKCWQRRKPGLIPLDRQQLLLLKQMKEMQHDNLNNFLGAIMDDGPVIMVFWKHCGKGSLHDLVMNEDIHLDQMFTVSILNDVISGLDYMHNKSPLHYHGNMSVTNCLVDSRWIVKLTDFGWVQLHETLAEQGHVQPKMANAHRLYHCAPEILRQMDPENIGAQHAQHISMQAADIYSFSIVLYHVLFRTEPYSDDHTEPSVILEKIQDGFQPYMRPVAPKDGGARSLPNLIGLMQNCWAEEPNMRPSITDVKRTMYSYFGKTLNRSLMDHVMSLLEKYATNLERIVEERTQQLELERKRADQLLYQMLPRSVADMLKSGQSIEPEWFEDVTIYFSDIVGFTSLSSLSTPMEVVAMLNSLYSAFDESIRIHDVYKVETIGDAYMVVSGLPNRNGVKHVFEICDMALSILEIVSNFEIAHRPGERLRIRIGVHSGAVAAGVVGLTMPRYCLFGDTVNTASRMESNGMPLKIHISEQTKELLTPCPDYVLDLRGQIELKGKGLCTTYWLLEKRKANAGMYQGMYSKNMDQPD